MTKWNWRRKLHQKIRQFKQKKKGKGTKDTFAFHLLIIVICVSPIKLGERSYKMQLLNIVRYTGNLLKKVPMVNVHSASQMKKGEGDQRNLSVTCVINT